MTRPFNDHSFETLSDQEGGNQFATFDLGCSAALVSAGFALVKVDKSNPRKAQFVFTDTGSIAETIEQYWSDQLTVNARTYFDNIKMLKNRLYSQ